MKRFLLPVVFTLLTSCFGAGNLCAQGGGKIVKAVTETVVKSGTKAAEKTVKQASAQAAKASYINIVVRGHTIKLPEDYKTLSNTRFTNQLFSEAKSNTNRQEIKAMGINLNNRTERKEIKDEINATLTALSELLIHPEIVVAYSHKMPFMPTGGVINGKLSPAQRLEQLNKAIDYAIKNPQEVTKAVPNVHIKAYPSKKEPRTREERLVQAVIFTRVYGRWFSAQAGVDALITKEEEHNFYEMLLTIKRRTKDDEISKAITNLIDEYAADFKSPEYWLKQLKIFVEKHDRLPSKVGPEEEERKLYRACNSLVYNGDQNNKTVQEVKKIFDEHKVRRSPSEVLAAFYDWRDTLEANGEPLRLPQFYSNIKPEELTDPQKSERSLCSAMMHVRTAFNAGTIKDPEELKAAQEIVRILSPDSEYRTRAKRKTTEEVYQNALMFFKTTSSYPSQDAGKEQKELYLAIRDRLYYVKKVSVQPAEAYYEEFARTGVATPDPNAPKFDLKTDEGKARTKLLQLDQLARACARGENPEIFSWDIFNYEDPLAELANRIASQQEAVAAQVAAPDKEIKTFSPDEAQDLWDAFPDWLKKDDKNNVENNINYATNNATYVALMAVKKTVKKWRNEIEAHSSTTNIIDELMDMTAGSNTLGYNKQNGKFYKILFRGKNSEQPQPGDFYRVVEEFGVPGGIVPPDTKLTTSWDWDNNKLKSITLTDGVTQKEIEALFDGIKTEMGGEIRMGMHELDIENVKGSNYIFGSKGRAGQIHVHFEKFARAEDGPTEEITSYTLKIDASALIENAANDNVRFDIYSKFFGSYINLFR